ncbi:MAG: hypothetical protein Q8K86_05980 [Candidatus Nanopelagicaceae bacterium]|nr:hypothetical protein [Candidatus Nanopelagicaceae bacterium]
MSASVAARGWKHPRIRPNGPRSITVGTSKGPRFARSVGNGDVACSAAVGSRDTCSPAEAIVAAAAQRGGKEDEMSHVATVQIELKDMEVLKAVCAKHKIPLRIGPHTVELYSGHVACDASFKLPGWRYPVAVVGKELKMDNFLGRWGQQKELDAVVQGYAVEKTTKQARSMGYSVSQQQKTDGTVQLTLYR